MDPNSWDVIVAGGGPAGLSAALMLGRSRRRVRVIDAGSPRNRFAAHMHGVLGQEGVPPAELLERGRAEAAAYGVDFADGSVEHVERVAHGLRIVTADGREAHTRALIVATGLTDALPDVPGLAERWGLTVLHCPYCHGWEVRDRRLGVLTTSPLGLHQAELVRQWSDDVTVFSADLGPLAPETERRLRARGIVLVPAPVTELVGEGTSIAAVRLADGSEVSVDAIFTAGAPRPHDGFLAPLDLARSESPFGSFLAVDAMGKTSDDRIWAVGNVVNPAANVPLSMGAGAFAGAAVNGALVTWDFDAAVRDPAPQAAPADFWEERYAGSDRVWSGRVNAVLAAVAGSLPPGRSLDLGCGEGADVIWLAQRGWDATGIDISPTAIRRATAAAQDAGLDGTRARFLTADLAELPADSYDLVTASFLHSPVELPRAEILRRAAERVAPGGHLLITSHAGAPPWAEAPHGHEHRFLTPDEELAQLALDADEWDVLAAETRRREATAPDGEPATLDDVVVLARRR
ncbi:bifunctional NAD(P)/FAD-dependent oxidoreductase/class I SAM-dependent methyltransferase [Microbacterium album]|uniref:Methyltransferase n=1 Tax=Microbacterium album TaxID=2053191 RepID=A0A917MLH4_9MICO|nr:bifunctional NAD(P)/FAD-dependent oxidoreductase/class I SAM-dependent methyltransferase [Microbacterium album]GGH38124.1 methyltransferase [Microbacterium album]